MGDKRREYTDPEKRFIVNAYNFFARQKENGLFHANRTIELEEECLGPGSATVQRIVDAYKTNGNSIPEPSVTSRGRPVAYDVLEIAPTITDYIITQNMNGNPTTTNQICDEVEELHGVRLGVSTMTRLLKDLGFHYVKGEKRHMHVNSTANVAFREKYLAMKLANRTSVPGPHGRLVSGVVCPEVYLDESYCNVNHVSGKTWLTSDKVRFGKTGKGPRACIVAAGIIKTVGCVTSGSFVDGSIKVWNSTLKRKAWEDDDYHGNFDAPQFERWFAELCQNLEAKHGTCYIYMDGASYHKRITNKCPTKSWRKKDIIEWVEAHVGMVFNPKATVATLLDLIETYKEAPSYRVTEIASQHGHLVFFTPPYHPTLQPIELMWGIVKGDIARSPAKNGADLIAKVLAALEARSDQWVSIFRHAQSFEDVYSAQTTEL